MTAPTPRLEFQWRRPTQDETALSFIEDGWICDYGLIIPLRENDIRAEGEDGQRVREELFVSINKTMVGGSEPEDGRTPYRDHTHAVWDSETLNQLPIWVLSLSGDHRPVNN